MRAILLVLSLIISSYVGAAENRAIKQGFSEAEMRFMADQNAMMAEDFFSQSLLPGKLSDSDKLITSTDVRPYAEYEEAGYLIFSSSTEFNSAQAKLKMAQELPGKVKLVVYTGSTSVSAAKALKNRYSKVLDPSRIHIVYMPYGGRGFWARDGVPVPVIRNPKGSPTDEFLTLVDARYYHNFEADKEFSELFKSEMTNHSFYYEGGNFMANSESDCLVVNTDATHKIPDAIFTDHYGCKKLVRLPYIKGIGHADESVKFIDTKTVMTDDDRYVSILEKHGFKVIKLPRPNRQYETYVNSLMVNGVVYVPIFNQTQDKQALQAYRDAGFKEVYGIQSITLSNSGAGSLHCITMTYPPVEMNDLLHSMGGYILQ